MCTESRNGNAIFEPFVIVIADVVGSVDEMCPTQVCIDKYDQRMLYGVPTSAVLRVALPALSAEPGVSDNKHLKTLQLLQGRQGHITQGIRTTVSSIHDTAQNSSKPHPVSPRLSAVPRLSRTSSFGRNQYVVAEIRPSTWPQHHLGGVQVRLIFDTGRNFPRSHPMGIKPILLC